ncbi:hypothetical protein EJ110_NYTH56998 [Nymphaea thermarum]|nr:hypothetical protein EJ110_NYTH56998 [Nymphaea thermarum]
MSVIGHQKEHVIEENELVEKSGKYGSWKGDNNIVMSWIMNSVQPQIASTIAYYTLAKQMWDFLKQTYTNDKNVSKILQGLSSEYAVAKVQMLTGAEIPDLVEAYNRPSRLAMTLSPPSSDIHASALATSGASSVVDGSLSSSQPETVTVSINKSEERQWRRTAATTGSTNGKGATITARTSTAETGDHEQQNQATVSSSKNKSHRERLQRLARAEALEIHGRSHRNNTNAGSMGNAKRKDDAE